MTALRGQHGRGTTGSGWYRGPLFCALSTLTLWTLLLAGAPVRAAGVSFSAQQIISAVANGANSVFVADVDGDTDLDVLSASFWDSKIAWYENVDGLGNFGPERVITTTASDARAVFAADLDGDGDVDVLSASSLDNKIAWYENTTCGDGMVEGAEACDDAGETAACDTDCTLSVCGDGNVNATAGEECDHGGESGRCDVDCTAAECGDDTLNVIAGEQCDGGLGCTDCLCVADFEPTDPPSLDCQPICGNGNVDPGEECDDGNVEPGDGCDENCQVRGACCERLGGLCMDRVSPESCLGTHAFFHLGVDCNALDTLCAAAFGACCRDDLGQSGGVRSCTSVILDDCRCPSCEWFKLRSCEDVITDALCAPDFFPIPTVSEWGLAALTLLLLTGGKIFFGRRSEQQPR